VGLLAGCGSSAHGTSSTASRSGRHGSAPAPHRSVTPRLHAPPATSVPIDGPPLQVGFGAVWSASSQGLVRLSVPGGRPQRVLRTAVDDLALAGCCVYALPGSARSLVSLDP